MLDDAIYIYIYLLIRIFSGNWSVMGLNPSWCSQSNRVRAVWFGHLCCLCGSYYIYYASNIIIGYICFVACCVWTNIPWERLLSRNDHCAQVLILFIYLINWFFITAITNEYVFSFYIYYLSRTLSMFTLLLIHICSNVS